MNLKVSFKQDSKILESHVRRFECSLERMNSVEFIINIEYVLVFIFEGLSITHYLNESFHLIDFKLKYEKYNSNFKERGEFSENLNHESEFSSIDSYLTIKYSLCENMLIQLQSLIDEFLVKLQLQL